MKIIEAGFSFEGPVDGPEMLHSIERAGMLAEFKTRIPVVFEDIEAVG